MSRALGDIFFFVKIEISHPDTDLNTSPRYHDTAPELHVYLQQKVSMRQPQTAR
jgi:hypothetical protein